MMARVVPVAGALLVLFAVIQLVPVQKSNPPGGMEIDAPLDVKQVFRRACYDCHSTETLWPWYSSVAPVSWLVAHDVREGRKKVNFTAWENMPFETEAEVIGEIWEEIEKDAMPPWFYRWAHWETRITDGEKAMIRQWSQSWKGRS